MDADRQRTGGDLPGPHRALLRRRRAGQRARLPGHRLARLRPPAAAAHPGPDLHDPPPQRPVPVPAGAHPRQERRSYSNSRRFIADLRLPAGAGRDHARARPPARRSASSAAGARTCGRSRAGAAAARGRPTCSTAPSSASRCPSCSWSTSCTRPSRTCAGSARRASRWWASATTAAWAGASPPGCPTRTTSTPSSWSGNEAYRFRGRTERMSCRNERFTFRASPTDLPDLVLQPSKIAGARTERICRTRHGPVQARGGGRAYARRYAMWDREIETLAGLARSTTRTTSRTCAGPWRT